MPFLPFSPPHPSWTHLPPPPPPFPPILSMCPIVFPLFFSVILSQHLCWGGSCSWCVKLWICRLWHAEWRSTRQVAVSVPEPQFGEVKTARSFWLKAQFPCTHTKEIRSQNLLLTDSKKGGRECGYNNPGEGQTLIPGHRQAGYREQGNKHLWKLGQG